MMQRGEVMNKNRNYKLTDTELATFHKNGYIGPFILYTETEIKEIYKEVRAQLFNRDYAPYDTAIDSAVANYDRHLDIDLLSYHICRNEIVDRLQGILGDNILCWRSEFIPKRPGSEGTDWHQADTFAHASGKPQLVWPNNDEQGGCINVWTAFTDATEETACMVFIPGTQDEVYYDESKAFSMIMKAGEFIIFRSKLLHASKPNLSKTQTRLGYVCRYVPGNVKIYPDTEYVEEFGGAFSLAKYCAVEVKGKNLAASNVIKTKNNRGTPFEK